jgi:hypothetical protein
MKVKYFSQITFNYQSTDYTVMKKFWAEVPDTELSGGRLTEI